MIRGTDFDTQTGKVLYAFVMSSEVIEGQKTAKQGILADLLTLERESFTEHDFQVAVIDYYGLKMAYHKHNRAWVQIIHEALVRASRVLYDFSKLFYANYFPGLDKALDYDTFMVALHFDNAITIRGLKEAINIFLDVRGGNNVLR